MAVAVVIVVLAGGPAWGVDWRELRSSNEGAAGWFDPSAAFDPERRPTRSFTAPATSCRSPGVCASW
ncbi:MAG: hypothetical protein MJE66_25170 [Proteobacteria bacterium]|nr:hypothetical protein [Pseudomonadota bacterium]